MEIKMKAILFARVSTREQEEEGYSLSAQIRLLKDYADKNNFSIVKQFIVPESATGAHERKIFNQLLDYLQENLNIKIQLWEKVDRSARNFQDTVRLDDWLNEDETRQIHFVKQSLAMHKNSKSHEKFMWDIYVATARQYSNNLSEETKKGLDEKALQGWFPGNHKRGYKSIGETGRKTWFVDENSLESKFITQAFELYDTGNHTLRTLSQELFKQGWTSSTDEAVSTSEVHNVLKDSFYCGEFIWKSKKYEGKHTPLISKELFYRVQERLQRKIRAGKYRKHSFLLGGGLLVCGNCGRAITAEVQKGHNYYHCTKYNRDCGQRTYVREEDLQNEVLKTLDKFKITNTKVLEWVRKALKESHFDESEYHSTIVNELETKKKQVEKRLDVLYDERIDGFVAKDFYDRKQKQYEEELNSVTDAIVKHTKANINYQKLGINIFELSQKGREIYEEKALPEEKRELLNFVFSNFQLKGKNLAPSYHNGFQVVAKRAESGNWLPD